MKKSNKLKLVWFLRIIAWVIGLIAIGFLIYGILKNSGIL